MQASTDTPVAVDLKLNVDRPSMKDALRGLLHAILFHRLLGNVIPLTVEVGDVSVPGVADPEVQRLVTDRVDLFAREVEGAGARSPQMGRRRGQVVVTFSDVKPKKSSWWSSGAEEVPWETWTIDVEIDANPLHDRDSRTAVTTAPNPSLSAQLNQHLLTILTHTNSERGRQCVPMIRKAGVLSPFPYQITIRVGGIEVGGAEE
ncbi:hypothetical protein DL93DRAFT_241328 [Clavulina sp. PMI_390]|nr:hypothetical protein DL93DRAFT_241328 [Clavulina sp. PMI_390]